MWKAMDKITSLYLEKKDLAVVFAHSMHLPRIHSEGRYLVSSNIKSLGTYINDKYKDKYFCVSLQAGMGSYTQDSDSLYTTFIAYTLDYPEINSFERFCLSAESDYFYYPANVLPKNICTLRLISRNSTIDRRQFRFLDLKNRFDAYVFIRNNSHLKDIFENHTPQFQRDFFEKRKKEWQKLIP
jgi:erythromycin esterase-like protein